MITQAAILTDLKSLIYYIFKFNKIFFTIKSLYSNIPKLYNIQ